MFSTISPAPPDPILGLTDAFKADPNPDKINLGVGVYKDEHSQTPVLAAVREAERQILEAGASKSYLPITGNPAYNTAVGHLMFGPDHAIVTANRAATCQTPGGTGALRVVGDYLHANHPTATLWLSDPTWANHNAIFAAAQVSTQTYAYFDPATNILDFDRMLESLRQIPAHDVVLLHGCCHNPTGVDPTPDQWRAIADILAEREILPLIDFAYQGFGEGLDEDAVGLRIVAERVPELLICSSFSKNFGLYNERIGAMTLVAPDPDIAATVLSQVKVVIRRNYSNPPAHGSAIVATILADTSLRQQWAEELATMRNRINAMRNLFVKTLAAKDHDRDFSFIAQQRGMFSFSGLNRDQVQQLREKHAIYIVGSGRINVAGMTPTNMPRLCDAIEAVL